MVPYSHSNSTNRILWVDSFRAIMIFAIAWGHALCAEPTSDSGVIQYLYSFHVPAFFFISGYTFHSESHFFPYAIKKFRTQMIPYYIFSLISILVFLLLGSFASSGLGVAITTTEIGPNILGMLYASGTTGYMKWNLPLWFIPCLFLASMLFFWLRRIIASAQKRNNATIAFILLLLISFLLSFLNYYHFHFSKLPFGFETVIYMLPFFIMGNWLKTYINTHTSNKFTILCIGALFLCVGTVLAFVNPGRVDYVSSAYMNLTVFYISAFSSILGFVFLSHLLPLHALQYVGKNTLAILVMHKFPIVFMQIFLISLMAKSTFIGIIIAFIMALIACVLSLAAGQIITCMIPFALGKQKANPSN